MSKQIIAIASDHAGFNLKQAAKQFLSAYSVTDLGTDSADSVDFPDYSNKLATFLKENEEARGIAFCGSGVGIGLGLVKNGIDCTLCGTVEEAKFARDELKVRAISIGERITGQELALEIINTFLS